MKKWEIKTELGKMNARSKWETAMIEYAHELLEGIGDDESITMERLLNGAGDWKRYSYGGCSLIYDRDIAERICTASELKRTRNGERKPNKSEEWLDVQARALYQAAHLIMAYATKEA